MPKSYTLVSSVHRTFFFWLIHIDPTGSNVIFGEKNTHCCQDYFMLEIDGKHVLLMHFPSCNSATHIVIVQCSVDGEFMNTDISHCKKDL